MCARFHPGGSTQWPKVKKSNKYEMEDSPTRPSFKQSPSFKRAASALKEGSVATGKKTVEVTRDRHARTQPTHAHCCARTPTHDFATADTPFSR